jgi:hypothetical protein
MIACDVFRREFRPGCEDASVLAHLRTCDACLATAIEIDPDAMFRAIGGTDMIPPGGVDAFVGDVMREVHLRETETEIRPHAQLSWMRRLAVAATLVIASSAALVLYNSDRSTVAPVVVQPAAAVQTVALSSRPVIEHYDSQNATIVEVPAEAQTDVKVVMIFDETLPADL